MQGNKALALLPALSCLHLKNLCTSAKKHKLKQWQVLYARLHSEFGFQQSVALLTSPETCGVVTCQPFVLPTGLHFIRGSCSQTEAKFTKVAPGFLSLEIAVAMFGTLRLWQALRKHAYLHQDPQGRTSHIREAHERTSTSC